MRRINSPEEMMLYVETLNTKKPAPIKAKPLKRWQLTENARIALILFSIMVIPMTLLYIACKLIESNV